MKTMKQEIMWKVSTNKKFFKYDDARKMFRKNGEFVLAQSRGKAKMVKVPHIGDKVVIVCDKKEVLIGEVISEFMEGTSHRSDECVFSIGGNDNHREIDEYLKIRIIGLGDLSYNRGVQRTWSQYKRINPK